MAGNLPITTVSFATEIQTRMDAVTSSTSNEELIGLFRASELINVVSSTFNAEVQNRVSAFNASSTIDDVFELSALVGKIANSNNTEITTRIPVSTNLLATTAQLAPLATTSQLAPLATSSQLSPLSTTTQLLQVEANLNNAITASSNADSPNITVNTLPAFQPLVGDTLVWDQVNQAGVPIRLYEQIYNPGLSRSAVGGVDGFSALVLGTNDEFLINIYFPSGLSSIYIEVTERITATLRARFTISGQGSSPFNSDLSFVKYRNANVAAFTFVIVQSGSVNSLVIENNNGTFSVNGVSQNPVPTSVTTLTMPIGLNVSSLSATSIDTQFTNDNRLLLVLSNNSGTFNRFNLLNYTSTSWQFNSNGGALPSIGGSGAPRPNANGIHFVAADKLLLLNNTNGLYLANYDEVNNTITEISSTTITFGFSALNVVITQTNVNNKFLFLRYRNSRNYDYGFIEVDATSNLITLSGISDVVPNLPVTVKAVASRNKILLQSTTEEQLGIPSAIEITSNTTATEASINLASNGYAIVPTFRSLSFSGSTLCQSEITATSSSGTRPSFLTCSAYEQALDIIGFSSRKPLVALGKVMSVDSANNTAVINTAIYGQLFEEETHSLLNSEEILVGGFNFKSFTYERPFYNHQFNFVDQQNTALPANATTASIHNSLINSANRETIFSYDESVILSVVKTTTVNSPGVLGSVIIDGVAVNSNPSPLAINTSLFSKADLKIKANINAQVNIKVSNINSSNLVLIGEPLCER